MSDIKPISPSLKIKLFGDVDVQVDGSPLPRLRARKELWLLALLVLQHERSVTRAWLAQTLWPFPDHSVDQARYNLRRALTNLRKALGAQAYRLQSPIPSSLRLDLQDAHVDVLAFDLAIRNATDLSADLRASQVPSSASHTTVTKSDTAALKFAIKAALSLYAAPLLSECTETWAIAERDLRAAQYLNLLKTLSAYALAGGDYESALSYLRRAVATDPLWEPTQRALMETLAQSGDLMAALQTYQDFALLLHRERDSEPGDETTALYHSLRAQLRQRPLTTITAADSVASVTPPLRRLPVPLTALIGRNEELKEIEVRFRQTRLLTLTGAGGIGKTRLAIQLAEEMAEEFRDGICFVDMAALNDSSQVVQMTAAALEVAEVPGQPLIQTLALSLRTRQLLLILDNCEHLIEASAQLAETLLQGCRALRILTTSRQSLGISGESFWRVPSLTMPDIRHLSADFPPDAEALAALPGSYSALQLFIARALQAQPTFCLTPANALAVIQICQQLDGIPLALELAAARVNALSVEQIAVRLIDRFALLTAGPRTALSRQQTLEAAIKWSFDLLSTADRAMLCALSLFVGGWTLEAAEAVAGKSSSSSSSGSAFHLSPSDVLDTLTRLVDRSLVIFENEGGQARYRLLETMRQYSREKLQEQHIVQVARERHLDFFLDMAEHSELSQQGNDQADWLDRLEKEHDNLRAALEGNLSGQQYSDKDQNAAQGHKTAEGPEKEKLANTGSSSSENRVKRLRLASALWRFWHRRGYLSLGRRYLANTLEETVRLGNIPARAKAYNGAGMLAFFQGDIVAAQSALETSLAIGVALKDHTLRAAALHSLGQMTWNRRDYARARTLFTEALTIQRELANRTETAITLNYLGVVASDEGDFEGARIFLEESLAISRDLGDKILIANSLHSLAHMALYQDDYATARTYYGEELKMARSLHNRDLIATALHRLGSVELADQNYAAARQLFEESLSIARALGYRDLVSAIVFSLGHAVRALGDYDAARHCYEERLHICEEAGDRLGISYALDAFAGLLVTCRQERSAVVLFASAQSLREGLVSSTSCINQSEQPYLLAAQSVLGEPAFTQLWEEGYALTQDEALRYALHPAAIC